MMGRSESVSSKKEREGNERREGTHELNGPLTPGMFGAGNGGEEGVESFGLARTPSLKGKAREVLSALENPSSIVRPPSASTLSVDGARTKKRSFFSKLGGRPRTPSALSKAGSETPSVRSATSGTTSTTSNGLPEVVVEKTRVDKGKEKEKIRYVKVSLFRFFPRRAGS